MAARRPLTGQSLLVASSALALGCSGGGAVTGNLVAPPMFELCVTAEPATAAVTIDEVALEPDGCSSVWEGEHIVAATAEGYTPHEQNVVVTENTSISIALTQAGSTP